MFKKYEKQLKKKVAEDVNHPLIIKDDLLLIKNTKQVVEKVFNQNNTATYSTTEQKTFQVVVAIDILNLNESRPPHAINLLKKMTTIHYISDNSKNIENFLQRI